MVAALVAPAAEFSFLLAGSGLDEGVLSDDVFSAIITAAVISIVLGPLALAGAEWLSTRRRATGPAIQMEPGTYPSRLGRIAILCGYNHVGETVAGILGPRFDIRVIEENPARVRVARERDLEVIEGSPISPAVLEHARIEEARVVVIALADPFATRLFAERARAINPYVDIVAHAVVRSELDKLRRSGIAEAVIAEDEVAFELARYGLHRFGLSARESLAIIQQWRARMRLAD
jgi:CPA2 family monovalent cation:H+ antiporter-2